MLFMKQGYFDLREGEGQQYLPGVPIAYSWREEPQKRRRVEETSLLPPMDTHPEFNFSERDLPDEVA